MSDLEDSSIMASLFLKSAIICSAPTCDAGQFSVGSNTMIFEICSGIFFAASVIIMPS